MSSQGPFELHSQALGALPIVDRFLQRMRLGELLECHLPEADGRTQLPAAVVIGVLVRNLAIAREPLYGLCEWAQRFEPALLGLVAGEVGALNDDRTGRALDELFDADRGSLLTELVVGVISEFQIDCSQLHNDSTSVSLHGAYVRADGTERGGKPTPAAAFGHSKDHRPDLKQLVLTLTVSADGAVPLAHRLLDGNVTDDQTHIDTWEELCKLVGRVDFLYVADSKLATHEQMTHISSRGGRFVSVLPRSRAEDAQIREWAQTHAFDWVEAARKRGRRNGDPCDVWSVAPAPIPTAEGYRIVWVRSSQKLARDAESRRDRIQRGLAALEEIQAKLRGPRARMRDRVAVEQAAQKALAAAGAQRWISFDIAQRAEESFRQERRGRPGKDTRYRRIEKTRLELSFKIDESKVAYDARTDGCFPLVSCDRNLTDAEVLAAYRYQPNLEKRHHELKSVLELAPIRLHSPTRIEGLACCQFIALLCQCLIEREIRRSMARERIAALPLYHERRAAKAPTAPRIFDLFADARRDRLLREGELIQTFEPELNELQHQVLGLLGVPDSAYPSARSDS